jgi:hypothetical protein
VNAFACLEFTGENQVTVQFPVQDFLVDGDDCGCMPLFDYPYDVVFVMEHCSGSFTVKLQGTNGGGWQSDSFSSFEEADAYATVAAIKHGAVKV